ncbi:MAG: hypothetical protein HY673_19020, partial [Chloroflexi bacterium]|nr:hypothetical protein [Chloroflexota bacterium]
GLVNAADLALVGASLNKRNGDPGFNASADLNGDGLVDVYHLVIAGLNWGNTG